MLLFTVFTRDLFDSLFTERFVEDSAVHASYAQGLMEAFLIIQGVELSPYLAPTEDLALWISSTLSNDVILYADGVLVASSRREFFDSGLLPEILDGEAYQALVYERRPFFIQRTRLGGYSFQTLTVPYASKGTELFISLPFPFEKEQLNKATREIVEFLVLLSAFFLVLVVLFSRGIKSLFIVPVRKLLAGTREVGLGNLEVSIEHQSRDEMMTLIDGFNTMIRNLKAHEQELAEMSKKVAWTEMARKVAHEIKNPLTPIQLSAEHVLKVYEDKRGDLDKALKESMSYIIGEVENLRRIAQEFMEIARDTTVRKEPVDLREPPRGGPPALPPAAVRAHPLHRRGRGDGIPGPRRRGQAQDGLPQRHRQRHRGHRPAGRGGGDDRPPGGGLRDRRAGHRAGHEQGNGRADLRALFFDQGRRHRAGPADHQEDRRGARRNDPRRERAGARHDGHDRAPGRRMTDGILARFLAE